MSMRPCDVRDLTFAELRGRIAGDRLAVLQAWSAHGPGTTSAVAKQAGIPLLTFRPRTTELFQLGAIALAGKRGHEGVYRARDARAHEDWYLERRIGEHQTDLKLGA